MRETDQIAPFVTRFFRDYLIAERNLSQNTVLSYRDALKLLLLFIKSRANKSSTNLPIQDITPDLIRQFLNFLEQERGNSIRSRNQRLAALRSFFEFVARTEPRHAEICRQIACLPVKRTTQGPVDYLEMDEITEIFNQIDPDQPQGLRDYALLLFLYNAGARVDEASKLRVSWVTLTKPYRVSILGKGRRWRVCPLWTATGQALCAFLAERSIDGDEEHVFLNRFGAPLSRHGIFNIVRKYAKRASTKMPRLAQKKISPHTIRHTTAMHMLQAGVDLNSIRNWLGHTSIETTYHYAHINLEMKTKAMEKCESSFLHTAAGSALPSWKANKDILSWLQSL
ncbi:MAG: integrase [Candidatus Hydrothermota bacterium]|nr:MAG: integrase [Candidatus Hydrothermae bacterium]